MASALPPGMILDEPQTPGIQPIKTPKLAQAAPLAAPITPAQPAFTSNMLPPGMVLDKPSFGDFIDDVWAAIKGAPSAWKAAAASFSEGADPREVSAAKDWSDRVITEDRKLRQQNSDVKGARNPYFDVAGITIDRQTLRNMDQQIAFSGLSMVASLMAGLPAMLLPVPGSGPVAAGAAGGAVGYRTTASTALRDLRDGMDREAMNDLGRPLTDDEFVRLAESPDLKKAAEGMGIAWSSQGAAMDATRRTALHEAGWEFAGNALMFGAGKAIFKIAKAGGVWKSIAVAAGSTLGEVATETETQIGQHNEAINLGLAPGEAKRSYGSLEDQAKSAREVGGPILGTFGLMSGAAHGAGMVSRAVSGGGPAGRLGKEMGRSVEQTQMPDAEQIAVQSLKPGELPPGLILDDMGAQKAAVEQTPETGVNVPPIPIASPKPPEGPHGTPQDQGIEVPQFSQEQILSAMKQRADELAEKQKNVPLSPDEKKELSFLTSNPAHPDIEAAYGVKIAPPTPVVDATITAPEEATKVAGKADKVAKKGTGRPIFDDIRTKLLAAGRSKQEAASGAEIADSFFTTQAKNTNQDPLELYRRYGITVNRSGHIITAGGKTLKQFAGELAATADRHALKTAMGRVQAGDDSETVRSETGWHQGPEGKWRFEISDDQAKLKIEGRKAQPTAQAAQAWYRENGEFLTLGKLMDHPRLFAAYPSMQDIRVSFVPRETLKGSNGVVMNDGKLILLSDDLDNRQTLSAIHHEVQHGIQSVEGFATGGNTESVKNTQEFKDALAAAKERAVKETPSWTSAPTEVDEDLIAQDIYRKLHGEVEARNTQRRASMTPEERSMMPVQETEDVPLGKVIVTFNGKIMESAPPPKNAQQDMFGGKNETQQAIKDRNIERQRKIDNAPPIGIGAGDLFSGKSKQADITGQASAKTVDPNNPNILFRDQKSPTGIPRGSVTISPKRTSNIINLFATANESTFFHEFGHIMLEVMSDLVENGKASPQMERDMSTTLDWLGADSTENITEAQHEKLARGWESWLRDGKAPSKRLAAVFKRISEWFKRIYRTADALNVEISDGMRDVFSRFLVTQEETKGDDKANIDRTAKAKDRYSKQAIPDPSTDDLLAAIAKRGGLSMEEAIEQGVDPADINKLGWRLKRVFTKGGKSFDEMAEALSQYGYPVFDTDGSYTANALLDSLADALMGKRVTTAYNSAIDSLNSDDREYMENVEYPEGDVKAQSDTGVPEQGRNDAQDMADLEERAIIIIGDGAVRDILDRLSSENPNPDADTFNRAYISALQDAIDSDQVYQDYGVGENNGPRSQSSLFGTTVTKRDAPYTSDIAGNPIEPVINKDQEGVDLKGEYSTKTTLVQESKRELGMSRVRSMEDAIRAMAYLNRGAVERFDALLTDKHGTPLAVVGSYKGAIDGASVHPEIVVSEAFMVPGATDIWFGHNHPSGNHTLSKGDFQLNDALRGLFEGSGITPRGIFAIGSERDGRHGWMFSKGGAETTEGSFDAKSLQGLKHTTIPVYERHIIENNRIGPAINSPGESVDAVHKIAAGRSGLMLLDNTNTPMGFVEIQAEMMIPLRNNKRMDALYRAIGKSNAARVILVNNAEYNDNHISNMVAFLTNMRDGFVLDVIYSTKKTKDGGAYRSMAQYGAIPKGTTFFQRSEDKNITGESKGLPHSKAPVSETPFVDDTSAGAQETDRAETADKAGPRTLYQSDQPKLSVVHNLTPENLKFADEMGGLAVPSLAVIKGDMNLEGYGEITLIGNRDLADPSKAEVYDADAYTSTFPSPEYQKVKTSKVEKLNDEIRPYLDKFEDINPQYRLWEYSREKTNPHPGGIISEFIRSIAIKAMYLKEHGVDVDPVIEPRKPRWQFMAGKEWMDFYKKADLSADNLEWGNPARRKLIADASDAVRNSINNFYQKKYSETVDAELMNDLISSSIDDLFDRDSGLIKYGFFSTAIRGMDFIGKHRVNITKTDGRLSKLLMGKEQDFKKWVEGKVIPMFGEPRLTLNGRKVEYNLDNIVRKMSGNGVKATEKTMVHGPGKSRATAAHRIRSLQEMRNRAEYMIGNKKDVAEHREAVNKALSSWQDKVIRYYRYSDTWSALDGSMKALTKYAQGKSMSAALRSEDFVNVPPHIIEEGKKASDLHMSAFVPYFEAKPTRAVLLEEFSGAVIPKASTPITISILKKHGIPYVTYPKSKDMEAARTNAVIKFRKNLDKKGSKTLFQRSDQQPESSDVAKTEPRAGPTSFNPELNVDLMFGGEPVSRDVAGTDLEPFLDKLNSEADAKELFARIVHAHEKEFEGARRGVIPWERTEEMARLMGWTIDDLKKRRHGQAFNAEEWEASRPIIDKAMEEIFASAKEAVNGSDEQVALFQQRMAKFIPLAQQVLGVRAEWGRLGSIMRKQAMRADQMSHILDAMGGRDTIIMKAKALADIGSSGLPPAKKRMAIVKISKVRRIDQVIEVWINALLSGPQTHVVNMTSNSLIALLSVPEQFVAGLVGKLHGGDKVYMAETIARAYGLLEGAKEGAILAAQTIRKGEGSDLFSKIEAAHQKAIGGKAGEIVRLPGTALTAMDEFFKAAGFRAEVETMAMRQAIKEGLTGQKRKHRVDHIVEVVMALRATDRPDMEHLDQADAFNSPDMIMLWKMHDLALDHARYMTYTNPLGPIGRTFQSMTTRWPFPFKFIMPFIRTPVNIVKFAGHRSPLALTMPSFWADFKASGAARDIAIARMVFGTGIGVTVMMMVIQGAITGSGPTGPDERRIWLEKYRPNSIKIGDTWYSYGRLEPMGMLFGVSSDFAEAIKVMPEKQADEVAMLIHASLMKNLASKTFLSGISQAVAAYYDPERYGGRWAMQFAGTLIPTGVAQIARVEDPMLRQAQGIIDHWKSRTPGLSKTLLPRLNIFGEPIVLGGGLGPDILSPVYLGTDPHDPVVDELLRLEVYPAMPQKEIGGVDLTPEQYNEYVELSGKQTKGFLDAMVASDGYRNTPDAFKADMLNEAFTVTRKMARAQMMMRHPEIIQEQAQKKMEHYGVGR